jgi:sRNA-binding regulator protein Hfq
LPKSKAPAQTLEEANYLRYLSDNAIPICVRLAGNEDYRGVIEFWDVHFIRLTRKDGPNLFIYKHDIKYLYELGEA